MRFIKILLIIAALAVITMVSYVLFYEILGRTEVRSLVPIEAYIYLALTFVTSAMGVVYHIISFPFYKSREKVNLSKKISKFLWVGGISFSSITLFIGGYGLYSFISYIAYGGFDLKQILFVVGFSVTGLLGFLELSILKRRIVKLKKEKETKDDIETIGNSTF